MLQGLCSQLGLGVLTEEVVFDLFRLFTELEWGISLSRGDSPSSVLEGMKIKSVLWAPSTEEDGVACFLSQLGSVSEVLINLGLEMI